MLDQSQEKTRSIRLPTDSFIAEIVCDPTVLTTFDSPVTFIFMLSYNQKENNEKDEKTFKIEAWGTPIIYLFTYRLNQLDQSEYQNT